VEVGFEVGPVGHRDLAHGSVLVLDLQGNGRGPPSPLEAPLGALVVGGVSVEAGEQKGAEASLGGVEASEPALLEGGGEEALREVLGALVVGPPLRPQVPEDRPPAGTHQSLEGARALVRIGALDGEDDGAVGLGKGQGAGDSPMPRRRRGIQGLGATVVGEERPSEEGEGTLAAVTLLSVAGLLL
jgi:hypothetical protein